ncbi:glycosyltransferase [Blastococcus mobilis]
MLAVNFFSAADLGICIDSAVQAGVASVTIVSNGDSEKGHAALTKHLASLKIPTRLYRAGKNLGFGAAANRAFALADPPDRDFVWLLNPDVVVAPDSLQRLVTATLDKGASLASPMIEHGMGSSRRPWFAGGFVDVRRGATVHLTAIEAGGTSGRPPNSRTPFITGAAPLVRSSAWRELGGFREDLFLYWEDAELSMRAHAIGMGITTVNGSTVWHRVGGSHAGRGRSPLYYHYMQRNRLRVCSSRPRDLIGLLCGPGLQETVRYLWRPIRHEPEERVVKFFASFGGLMRGILDVCRSRHEAR